MSQFIIILKQLMACTNGKRRQELSNQLALIAKQLNKEKKK